MSDDTRERSNHAARDASAPPNGSDGNQTMIQPDGHLDAEMVSAWLDAPDDFSEQDRLAIQNHLAACPQCAEIAAELTAIVRAFQALPFEEPPRSFALTPELAGLTATPTLPATRQLEEPANLHERKLERESRKPVNLYEPIPWYERQMTALRWATAVATLLFVFAFSADLLGNIDTGNDDDGDSAVMMEAPASTAASGAMPASGGAEATTTTGSGSSAQEPATEAAAEESDDVARSSEVTPTPAQSGAVEATTEPVPTTAAGATQATAEATGGGEDEEESPPENADVDPSGDDTETMLALETTEPGQADLDQEPQQDDVFAADNGTDVAEESQESDTLRLIELALAIVIAWLVVAMLALPRLRRRSG